MRRSKKTILLLTSWLFLILLVADAFTIGPSILTQQVTAAPREFEENLTVLSNEIVPLDLDFTQGDEMELIYDMDVKENLPVDIWFVNYPNYVRLVDGNEFLYFIDGSGEDLKSAAKVVSVTQHGTYKLVFANYNNVTVEINLKYDINFYPEEGEDQTFIAGMLIVGLVIGVVVGLLVSRIRRRPKKVKAKDVKAPKLKKKTKVMKKVSKKLKTVEAKEKTGVPKKASQPILRHGRFDQRRKRPRM